MEAIVGPLWLMLQWPTVAYLIAGTLIGEIFGAIPGLSGSQAVALMIPLTFSLPLDHSITLLVSTLGAAEFGGSISAILINVPGMSNNATTCLDGYPLTRSGRAGFALGASAAATALGGIFGVVVLAASLPVMRQVALAFGPPEIFLITFFGLTVIAITAEGKLLTSLISGGVGILLSFHGHNAILGGERYTFGTTYLWDGIKLLPVFIGLYGITGGIELLRSGVGAERVGRVARTGILEGMASVFAHWWLFIRSSAIGTIVGIIPGIGGSVANFIAYAHAVQTSKHPETFGRGNVAGVIAPESAIGAKDGGAMIPTLALGVPGSLGTAILLGAFLLHGVKPGRMMFEEHLSIVWTIVWALLLSNILSSVFGIAFSNQLVRVTTLPRAAMAAGVIVVSLVGAYAVDQNAMDAWMAVLFGAIGYGMVRFRYSRISLVVGLMLGGMTEEAFFQARQIGRGSAWIFFQRPVALLLLGLIVVSFAIPYVRAMLQGDTHRTAVPEAE